MPNDLRLLHLILQSLHERSYLYDAFETLVQAYTDSLPVVELLVHHGLLDSSRLLFLCCCSPTNSSTVVQWLIDHAGANVNATWNNEKDTCLHAALVHAPTLVPTLVACGADPSICNSMGHTALHTAASHCQKDDDTAMQCLLQAAPRELLHTGGYNYHETPLHLAAARGAVDVCRRMLVAADSSRMCRDQAGNTPWHLACRFGHVEVAQVLLLRHHDDYRFQTNDYGWSPLHSACRYGHVDMVKWLLECSSDCHIIDMAGGPPECCDEDALIVDEIDALEAQKYLHGETPLHVACQYEQEEVIRLLVSLGANVRARDDRRNMPLDLVAADSERRVAIYNLLLSEKDGTTTLERRGWSRLGNRFALVLQG